jgi:hypothetical protein
VRIERNIAAKLTASCESAHALVPATATTKKTIKTT